MRKIIWDGKPWQAFKTFAIIFSFIMNFILLIVLLLMGPLLLPIVNDIVQPIVGGLNDSFDEMSAAKISRTIKVEDTMPIAFTLPLSATTNVVVVDDVRLSGVPAQFVLPDGGGQINGQVSLALPAGLVLPVQLELDVPVDQEIPVALNVDVEIPLAETELGAPFRKLQGLFGPLNDFLAGLPASNEAFFSRIMSSQPPTTEATAAEAP